MPLDPALFPSVRFFRGRFSPKIPLGRLKGALGCGRQGALELVWQKIGDPENHRLPNAFIVLGAMPRAILLVIYILTIYSLKNTNTNPNVSLKGSQGHAEGGRASEG